MTWLTNIRATTCLAGFNPSQYLQFLPLWSCILMIIILLYLYWILNVSPSPAVQCPVKPVERDAPHSPGQTTLYNERETWARFRLSLESSGWHGGPTESLAGWVGSLNQYEIASFMRVVALTLSPAVIPSSDLPQSSVLSQSELSVRLVTSQVLPPNPGGT